MMVYDWQYDEAKKLGIKPCQCGGPAVIKEIGNARTKKRCVEMECTKCHIKRKQCILNSTGILSFEELKSRFIDNWNTRPLEQQLLKALDQILDDLSASTMEYPGHGVCRVAWDQAISAISKAESKL